MVETAVPRHSKTETQTNTKVTHHPGIEASAIGDMEVTPAVDIKVIAPTSMKPSIHTDGWFP